MGIYHGRMTFLSYGELLPVYCGVATVSGPIDVSAYNALSFWMRSPDGAIDPFITLHSPGSVALGTSVRVTATAYTADGGAFDANVWRHVIIPLSAFNGINPNGNAYTLASNANLIDAISISPSNYYIFGGNNYFRLAAGTVNVYTDTMDIDEMQFQAVQPITPRSLPQVFDSFNNFQGITQWGTAWNQIVDPFVCAVPSSSINSTYFGGSLSPIMDRFAGPFEAYLSGRVSGTLGAADGTGSCTPAELSYAGMEADFDPLSAPVNLATSGLNLTAGQVKGISFWLQLGPTSAAIDYNVSITKNSITSIDDYAQYYHLVPSAQLAGGGWVYFQVDFPPVGAPGTDFVNSFGQPAWAAGLGESVSWDTTDCIGIRIEPDPMARGQNFDIRVGQIKFY